MGWVQVPDAVVPPRRDRTLAVTAAIALPGPLVRAAAMPAAEPGVVASVVVLATLAAVATPRPRWWLRAPLAVAVAACLAPTQGSSLAVWSAFAVLMAAWVGRDRPPLPAIPSPGAGVATPVVALTLVAAWVGRDPDRAWQWAVPLAAAALVVLLDARWRGGPARFAHRVGTVAGDLVAAVAFTLLGALLVVAPWAIQRTAGIEPLGRTGAGTSGWARRRLRRASPRAPWTPDAVPTATPSWRTPRALATVAGLTAVAVLAVQAWPFGIELPSAERTATAHDGDEWYPQYQEDIAWVLDEGVSSRPFMVYPVLDAETRTVTVRDGYRVGWTAPACDCRRLTVWLYGGDGAFGFDQRDDHTISSELARLAAEDGLVVDVANRGLPGQPQWRASLRLANDLTVDDPPDLVLFYVGSEELAAATAIDERAVADPPIPSDAAADALFAEVGRVPEQPSPPEPGSGIELVGEPDAADRTSAEVDRLAVARFVRFRGLGLATATDAGVPIRYAWQPSDDGAPTRATLPDDVIDLRDLLRSRGDEVFVDRWRHDEEGARAVAAALWRELEPELRALATDEETGR